MTSVVPPERWAEARALYEAGATFVALARRLGVHRATVARRAKREGWNREKKEKADLVLDQPHTDQGQTAVVPASQVAAVIQLHREKVREAWERLDACVRAHEEAVTLEAKRLAFEDLKRVKISVETMMMLQRMDRLNWGLDQAETRPEIVIERSY
jgi:uncharacterized protein (DUF849 family)